MKNFMKKYKQFNNSIENIIIIIIIIIEVCYARLGESAYQRPHGPQYKLIYRTERRETVEAKNGTSSLCQYKSIGPALKTRQSHTIEYVVSKFVS